MSHRKTPFTDSKSTGKNTDQGVGGGHRTSSTTGARGGNISPRDDGSKTRGSHLVPAAEDITGPASTPGTAGQTRQGTANHNPAEAKGKAGNHRTPRKG